MSRPSALGPGSGPVQPPEEQSVPHARQVRDALRYLHDPTHLQTHPLARLSRSEADKRAPGRGKALQSLLLAAIEAMRPTARPPGEANPGRSHQLLVLRYVDGLEPGEVQSKLAIGKSEYYVEHQRAINAVTSWLEERWQSERQMAEPDARDVSRAPKPVVVPNNTARSVPVEDEPRRHNLPLQLTSFVGRQAEIVDVQQLLESTRLVTLTGVGGCGKTRLALQVAASVVDAFPDGVWLVELAQITDATLVAQTVATAIGVQEQPGRPVLDTLVDFLRSRGLLLILDNCEHLIETCARLTAAILRACPDVRVLATSREALGITGEIARSVPSLPVPPLDWETDPLHVVIASLGEFAAIRLFFERARAADPSFRLTDQNVAAVVQICRRVDGIPLAIELAASRVKVFTVERIVSRLDDLFRLLTGGSRAALPRQQTLRALIDWSYNLLSDPERILFRRLSVFVAGCSYEAIEGVGAGEGVDPLEVPDILARLVERSLVVMDRGEQERYRLLETLRQYGQERLAESGESERIRDRHRDWYLKLALEAKSHYWGRNQGHWYELLELDQGNLRSAIEWCISQGKAQAGLEFIWCMGTFWFFRGYPQEGVAFAERLLGMPGAEVRTRGRAQALWLGLSRSERDWDQIRQGGNEVIAIAREIGEISASVIFALFLADGEALEGHDDRAEEMIQESLAIARRIGDAWLEGQSLEHLGTLARRQGHYDQAFECYRGCLACMQAGDDVRAIGSANSVVGVAALDLGRLTFAQESLRRGMDTARALRLPRHAIQALVPLAAATRLTGDVTGARNLIEETLAIARETRNQSIVGTAWLDLGYHDWVLGDLAAAQSDLVQGLAQFREGQRRDLWETEWQGVSIALAGVLAFERGDVSRGARLLGAAERFGFRPAARYPDERERYAVLVSAARERIGDAAFVASSVSGEALTLKQAIAFALETVGA